MLCLPYRREALPFVAEGRTWSPNMWTFTKPVYASPTITAVNLDSSRADESNPQPCYPDICFAVDNFDNAFENMVRLGAWTLLAYSNHVFHYKKAPMQSSCKQFRALAFRFYIVLICQLAVSN